MIKTVNLQKVYRTEEVETTALRNVNLEISEGEFVAVMGPSGCGKSTLLNVLGLLDNPTDGEYYLNDVEVSKHTERQRADTRKENIGFVFQSFNLIDELTVAENIELPLLYLKMPSKERRKRVDESMEYMGIIASGEALPAAVVGRSTAARGRGAGRHFKSENDPCG